MSIINNLKRSGAAVAISKFKQAGLGTQLANAAADAITKGVGSDEWNQYMALFCDTPEELELLTKPKEDEPAYLRRTRAYILANSICSSDTGTRTANGVNVEIDNDVSASAADGVGDPAALRAELGFEIPQV